MGASRSNDANSLDLLGDAGGVDLGGLAGAAPGRAVDPTAANVFNNRVKATQTANINAKQDRTSGTGAALGPGIFADGGAYNNLSGSSKANYGYMHDLGKNNSVLSFPDLFNKMGEGAGISHAGDAVGNPLDFTPKLQNPLDALKSGADRAIDPDKGLGTTMLPTPGGSSAGRPVTNMTQDTRALANGLQNTSATSIAGDALSKAMTGLTGGTPVGDTSGADRGGMTGHTPYDPTLNAALGQGQNARALGADVLSGNAAAPNPADAQRQGDALSQAMGFMNGPRATSSALAGANAFQTGPKAASGVMGDLSDFANGPQAAGGVMGKLAQFKPKAASDVMGDLTAFTQAPEGPSQAEIQLQQQSGKNMADALSLARSGRARDAGSQARALNVAQAENAQTNADTNQQAALLRANEAATARGQNLTALGQKGSLAQGVDAAKLQALGQQGSLAQGLDQNKLQALGQQGSLAQGLDQNTLQGLSLSGDLSKSMDANTLSSLGLTGDLATQMRNAGITERGQNLNFAQGQEQVDAGLTGDVLKTIPQLEQTRHADQFDLTPEQKVAQTKIAANANDKSTLDYILGLGKDVLPLL